MVAPAFGRLAALMGRLTPAATVRSTQEQLIMAGGPMEPVTYYAFRAITLLALPGLLALVVLTRGAPPPLWQWIALAGSVALAYWIPPLWLSLRVQNRKEEIERALPDALDLITVSIEAGLGLDAAFARVAERTRGALAFEFRNVLSDVGLGRMRREALHDLGKRTGVDDLVSFAAAIIQADQTGISIGQVLRVQSDQIRTNRRQKVEEAAAKLPTKMVFPLVLCIFPTTFIVILGPSVIVIWENVINR